MSHKLCSVKVAQRQTNRWKKYKFTETVPCIYRTQFMPTVALKCRKKGEGVFKEGALRRL